MIEISDHKANLEKIDSLTQKWLSGKLHYSCYSTPGNQKEIKNNGYYVMDISKTLSSDVWFNAMIGIDHQKIFEKIGDVNSLVNKNKQHFYYT